MTVRNETAPPAAMNTLSLNESRQVCGKPGEPRLRGDQLRAPRREPNHRDGLQRKLGNFQRSILPSGIPGFREYISALTGRSPDPSHSRARETRYQRTRAGIAV